MNTTTCEHRSDVLAALAAGRLMATPALMDHVGVCATCAAAVGGGLLEDVLDRALSEPAARADEPASMSRMSEDEAALLLSGFGAPMPDLHTLSIDDRRRLQRVARALDASAPPGEPRIEQRLWALGVHTNVDADAPAEPETPPEPPVGPARWTLIVAVAAAAMLAVGLGGVIEDERIASGPDAEQLVARTALVDMELDLGDRRCTSTRDRSGRVHGLGEAKPCRWRASTEMFNMHVRVEPDADIRHLAVVARDSAGEVTLLYPRPGNRTPERPLATTLNRESLGCAEGLCWLEGGRYDTRPGRLSVVAVFSTEPLSTADMLSKWAPRRWAGPERLVERFELEVVP